MQTVHNLLQYKGDHVITVPPECTVFDALKLMNDHNIGAVVVTGTNGTMLGILTERDYARKVVLAGRSSKETLARDIMTREVVYVKPAHTIEQAMAVMTDHRCRHLPVLDGKELVGLISIGDVVRGIIHDKEFVIEQLKHYITGSL